VDQGLAGLTESGYQEPRSGVHLPGYAGFARLFSSSRWPRNRLALPRPRQSHRPDRGPQQYFHQDAFRPVSPRISRNACAGLVSIGFETPLSQAPSLRWPAVSVPIRPRAQGRSKRPSDVLRHAAPKRSTAERRADDTMDLTCRSTRNHRGRPGSRVIKFASTRSSGKPSGPARTDIHFEAAGRRTAPSVTVLTPYSPTPLPPPQIQTAFIGLAHLTHQGDER